MGNIIEMLYDLSRERVHGQDSPFVRMARIKSENLELLAASMTDGQMDFDRFRFAFHTGAQIMAERIEGKGGVL